MEKYELEQVYHSTEWWWWEVGGNVWKGSISVYMPSTRGQWGFYMWAIEFDGLPAWKYAMEITEGDQSSVVMEALRGFHHAKSETEQVNEELKEEHDEQKACG